MNNNRSPALLQELLATFDEAVKTFNANKANDLAKGFDDNIVLIKVGEDKPIVGKKDVTKDFEDRFGRGKTTFIQRTVEANVVERPNSDASGVVSGIADWKDVDGDSDGSIQYFFLFRKRKGHWLMRVMCGSPSFD